jgi:hypothetical protein
MRFRTSPRHLNQKNNLTVARPRSAAIGWAINSESCTYLTPLEVVLFPDLRENVYECGSAAIYLDISSVRPFGYEVGRVLRNLLR